MHEKELANAIVALLDEYWSNNDGLSVMTPDGMVVCDRFVRSWAVAGVLLEKVKDKEWLLDTMDDGYVYIFTDDDRHICSDSTEWPLAFIEVCVDALTKST